MKSSFRQRKKARQAIRMLKIVRAADLKPEDTLVVRMYGGGIFADEDQRRLGVFLGCKVLMLPFDARLDVLRVAAPALLPDLDHEPAGAGIARSLTTERLKALWDAWDGSADTDEPGVSGEAVHWVMNERGEGAYVAV